MMIILFFLSSYTFAQQSSSSFLINISENKVKVISQKEKGDFAGIILKNETFEKIIAQIKSENKTLKRISIKPGHSKSFQILHKDFKKLFFMQLSPPRESLELKIGGDSYEVP